MSSAVEDAGAHAIIAAVPAPAPWQHDAPGAAAGLEQVPPDRRAGVAAALDKNRDAQRSLDLGDNNIGTEVRARSLRLSTLSATLVSLDLGDNSIGAEDARALAGRPTTRTRRSWRRPLQATR